MNCLGITCSVEDGLARLMVVILTKDGEVFNHIFRSPSVFSFNKNSAEILNWHRDNILSLLTQFEIEAVVVKKTERTSFYGKPSDSDILKLYLEGLMLALTGTVGKLNKHFYKKDVQTILDDKGVFDKDLKWIFNNYSLKNSMGKLLQSEMRLAIDTLLATVALKKFLTT